MSLQIHHHRPRELKWYHAAGMLFGDWGTSRLYVLGLAFYFSGTAAPYHIALAALTRIDHPVFEMRTKRTFHKSLSCG